MALQEASILSTYDHQVVDKIRKSGLAFIEVAIYPFSTILGERLQSIRLPELTRVICLFRKGEPILDLEAVFLEEGDLIHLLTEDESSVREAFMAII